MRLAAHLGFDGVKDGLRMQVDVAQDLGEEIPVGLREGDKQMLVAQDTVLSAPGVVDGAVDDALGRFTNFAGGDVEIFQWTLRLLAEILASLRPAVVDGEQGSPGHPNSLDRWDLTGFGPRMAGRFSGHPPD